MGNFAHLLGLGRAATGKSSAAEDDEDPDKKAKKAADDDKGDKDSGDDDDKKAADDDDSEGDDKKAKKAKKADDGDDGNDEEMSEDDEDEDDKQDRKDAKASAARGRERARCLAILGSKHSEGRAEMALHLAMNTSMGRRQAVALLKASPKSQATSALSVRMQGMETVRPGPDGNAKADKRQVAASSWDASAKRVGLKRG